jgi:hypothetical protein
MMVGPYVKLQGGFPEGACRVVSLEIGRRLEQDGQRATEQVTAVKIPEKTEGAGEDERGGARDARAGDEAASTMWTPQQPIFGCFAEDQRRRRAQRNWHLEREWLMRYGHCGRIRLDAEGAFKGRELE